MQIEFKVGNIVVLNLSYFFKESFRLEKATNSTVSIKSKIFTLLNFI